MRTQEERKADKLDSLRMYQEDVRQGITMFCQTVWQDTSSHTKEKYHQYGMSKKDLLEALAHYSAQGGESFMDDVFDVLSFLTGDESSIERVEGDQALAGKILRASSFALCLLGGDASVGDVEFFVRDLHRRFTFTKKSTTPREMWELYKRGYGTEFLNFLNWRLKESVKEFKSISGGFKRHYMLQGAPAPWIETEYGFEVDIDILETNYHLHASLLRYLEMPAGTA